MKDFDFENFWNDSAESNKDWTFTMPTDEELQELEKGLGIKLPQSYIDLMKSSRNGGLLKRNSFVKVNDKKELIELYKIDYIDSVNKLKSESQRKGFPGLATLPDIGIYFGSNLDGREKFALDYLGATNSEPCVSVILYSSKDRRYYPKRIAATFQEFVESLRKLEKPAPLDFIKLKELIKVSSKAAYEKIQQTAIDKIIAFGLFTSDDAKFVAPAANTREHLASLLKEFPGDTDYYTFATTEWEYEGSFSTDTFHEINEIIGKAHIYLVAESQIKKFRKQIIEASLAALKELKDENIFPKDLILMINISNEQIPKAQFKKIIKELNG